VTIDYDVIKAWANRRDARPSTVIGDERSWPLLFSFGPPAADVTEIDWDRFFAEFERANLAFACRDVAGDGTLDDFHEFVNRSVVPELAFSTTVIMRVT